MARNSAFQTGHNTDGALTLSRAEEKLLRTINGHDAGDGVLFEWLPFGRYRMVGSDYIVRQRTFFPLTGHQLVTDGGQEGAPVRITDAGRAWIAARQGGAR